MCRQRTDNMKRATVVTFLSLSLYSTSLLIEIESDFDLVSACAFNYISKNFERNSTITFVNLEKPKHNDFIISMHNEGRFTFAMFDSLLTSTITVVNSYIAAIDKVQDVAHVIDTMANTIMWNARSNVIFIGEFNNLQERKNIFEVILKAHRKCIFDHIRRGRQS